MCPTIPDAVMCSHAQLRVDSTSSDSSKTGLARRSYYRAQPARRRAWRYTSPTSGGKSWQAPADAARAEVTLTPRDAVWPSRKVWLHSLTIAVRYRANGGKSLTLAEGRHTLAQVKVETLLDVAWEDAATADGRTGRHVRTSHATVAKRLGCSPRTVRRCRALIEALGYARTTQRGRYLTNEEREAAYQARGRWQLRMASERALTIPRKPIQSSEKGHLPQRGSFNPSVTSVGTHLARVPREGRGSRHLPKTRTNKERGDDSSPRWSLPIQRLAAHLVDRLPSLAPKMPDHETHRVGRHIGQVCRVLTHVGIDPTEWTARDLEEAMNRRNHELGRDSLHRGQQRNPMGWLTYQLRTILDAAPEGPEAARRRDREVRAVKRQQQEALRAQLDAQVAQDRASGRIRSRAADARALARATRVAAENQERKWRRVPVILDSSPAAARHRF